MKQKGNIVILILILIALGISGYFAYRYYYPQISKNVLYPLLTSNWKTYTNEKFGFTLNYPQNLNLTISEHTSLTDPKMFNFGDVSPPDWIVLLNDQNNSALISINIYEKPMAYVFGGIEHNNFTFVVSTETSNAKIVNSDTTSLIDSSIRFFEPKAPLTCLWTIKNGTTGFDPNSSNPDTITYIQKNKSNMTLLTGFYYDQSKNICNKSSYYTWSSQVVEDSLPFKDINDCKTICVK